MTPRDEVLKLVKEATQGVYPVRWVDGETSRGDFDGRDVAIDVFNIPPTVQRAFLKDLRGVRNRFEELVGSRCLFIFHSPEATKEHYQKIVDSIR